MKLVDQRRWYRDQAVERVLELAETLKKCVEIGSTAGEYRRVLINLETHVSQAATCAACVEDLEDVEQYGESGGR